MSMADVLLSRLPKVKKTGPGRWMAACPAHEDKRASLLVSDGTSRTTGEPTVSFHCFALCDKQAILDAVGLTFADLYEKQERIDHRRKPTRRPFNAFDILECVKFEITVAAMIIHDIYNGVPVSDEDRQRFLTVLERLVGAAELANAK
jgi:hypothetical protein